jgi:membrane protein involved in colicin uptake
VEPRVPEVTMLGGSSGSNLAAVDTATVEKATADKEVMDAAVAKKVANDIVATAVKAAADKVVADAVVAKKVMDDVMAAGVKVAAHKEVMDADVAKKATDNAALMKGVAEETTRGSTNPGTTPTPAVGTKRPAALSGSSLPANQSFRGSWRAWYVKHSLIWLLS